MQIIKPYIIELAPTLQHHWYFVWKAKPDGNKGSLIGCFPSSTTILNAYPQSVQLTQWIATQGWSEAQRIKSEAGERGTKIHAACDLLEEETELYRTDFSLEEWNKISSFVDWHVIYKPELIAKEFPIFSARGKYAGRLDRIYKIGDEITILDLKSGAGIHEHFPLQFASYAKAIEEMTDLKIDQTACLQLGAKNSNKFRYVVYPDWKEHYKVFESVRVVWEYDNKKQAEEPPVLNLPPKLKLIK